MENFMWLPAISVIESFVRIFAYMTLIAVGLKLFQALNIYINKNMK